MSLDFTLSAYGELCRTITALDCPVGTVSAFMKRPAGAETAIVLRHDVDRLPAAAVRMAALERRHGIRATYYFRFRTFSSDPGRAGKILEMEHEIGYHHEAMAEARGHAEKAMALFADRLASMRKVVPVATVSAHGSPFSPHDNAAIWKHCEPARFGLLGDAGVHMDLSAGYYFTDTGRCWNASGANIRDRVPSMAPPRSIRSTRDLAAFLAAGPEAPIVISAHPNRWAAGPFQWILGFSFDMAANAAKRAWRPGRGWAGSRGEKRHA